MISMVKIAILIVFNHEGNNSKIVVRKGGRERVLPRRQEINGVKMTEFS